MAGQPIIRETVCETMDEATRLFSKVFFVLTGPWADTLSFRRIMLAGVADAQRQLLEQYARCFDEFSNDPTNDAVFPDKAKYLERVGGVAGSPKAWRSRNFVEHYYHERNHQGLGNQLIAPAATQTSRDDRIVSRQRLGGLLKYSHRPAA